MISSPRLAAQNLELVLGARFGRGSWRLFGRLRLGSGRSRIEFRRRRIGLRIWLVRCCNPELWDWKSRSRRACRFRARAGRFFECTASSGCSTTRRSSRKMAMRAMGVRTSGSERNSPLLFAKSLCPTLKDFFLPGGSSSVWNCRLIRRPAKDARRKRVPWPDFKKMRFVLRRLALESTLPPHNDGAARRVAERIESCFHAQSEFLQADLLACPLRAQDASGPHDSRAGRKTSAV